MVSLALLDSLCNKHRDHKNQDPPITMKSWSIALTALALLLLTWSTRAKAEFLPSIQVHSWPSSKTSSSRHAHRKNLSKQLDSSFRRIPPSKSNPTQNKFNPPTYGSQTDRQNKQQYRNHPFLF
ncbi:hypothetical protein HKD37_03G008985 [Glycine soja]|nr:hypothetical protein JHK87_008460 [Glycine soja]